MTAEQDGNGDFISFYREYARSGIHAAAAALLTLFGLLASIAGHWAFIGVGVAIYVLPPVYLYTTRDGAESDTAASGADASSDTGANATTSNSDAASEQTTPESPAAERGSEPATDDVGDASTAAPGATESEQSSGWRWEPRDAPTDADLADAVAVAGGACAVGTGGVVLARRDGNWTTVVEDGAGGDGNDFTAVDATTDGAAAWAVGDSGAVARVDVEAGDHEDVSAPNDLTSTWTAVAVAGPVGEETVYLANGSGVVLRGVMVDGDVQWGDEQKPGSGSSVADIDFQTPQRGVLCDTAGGVFETLDGDAFDRIGIDDLDGTLTAVVGGGRRAATDGGAADASGAGETVVAADDGSLHQHDGTDWTRDRLSDAALFGLAVGHGDRLAVGDGGTVVVDTGAGWEVESAPIDASLRGAALPDGGIAVAVGDGGALIERQSAASTEQ